MPSKGIWRGLERVMRELHNYRTLLFVWLMVIGLITLVLIIWQANRSKPPQSAFEVIWARLGEHRVRAVDQATIDFGVVHKVMKHYCCREFEEFFKYHKIMYGLSPKHVSSAKRLIQRGRDHLLPDVDCSTEVRVLGYSNPNLGWARFMGIMLLPDRESYQLARLHDTYGYMITPAERAIWKKVAFIEVSIGNHILITIWYHDGTRFWLLSWQDREEVERDMGAVRRRMR